MDYIYDDNKWKNMTSSGGRIYPIDRKSPNEGMTLKEEEHFNKLLFKSKGLANDYLFFELMRAGVSDSTILKLAKELEKTKALYLNPKSDTERFRQMRKPNPRCYKERNNSRVVPIRETMYGRKIREIIGEEHLTPPEKMRHKWCVNNFVLSKFYYGTMIYGLSEVPVMGCRYLFQDCTGDGLSQERVKSIFQNVMIFGEYNEERRQKILENDFAVRTLTSSKIYAGSGSVTTSPKAWAKLQNEFLYEDLYSFTQAELEPRGDGVADNFEDENSDRYEFLSVAGFKYYKINNNAMIGLITTAYMSMERIGLGVLYDKRNKYRYNPTRGYKRILQHFNQAYKTFDKLCRQGIAPESAREAVYESLKLWLSEYKNTDTNWRLYKRSDWVAPEKIEKTKTTKTTTTRNKNKTKVVSAEDIASLFADEEGES